MRRECWCALCSIASSDPWACPTHAFLASPLSICTQPALVHRRNLVTAYARRRCVSFPSRGAASVRVLFSRPARCCQGMHAPCSKRRLPHTGKWRTARACVPGAEQWRLEGAPLRGTECDAMYNGAHVRSPQARNAHESLRVKRVSWPRHLAGAVVTTLLWQCELATAAHILTHHIVARRLCRRALLRLHWRRLSGPSNRTLALWSCRCHRVWQRPGHLPKRLHILLAARKRGLCSRVCNRPSALETPCTTCGVESDCSRA